MKNSDKFLAAIVIGMVLLIVTAIAVVLLRPKPGYQADDTAEGAAHNYLLAIQQKEYTRAYTYLSPDLRGYPDSEDQFIEDVREYDYRFGGNSDSTLEVISSEVINDVTVVTVRETSFYDDGLFSSNQYTNTFEMTLVQEPQSWKIIDADSYWIDCWNVAGRCQ